MPLVRPSDTLDTMETQGTSLTHNRVTSLVCRAPLCREQAPRRGSPRAGRKQVGQATTAPDDRCSHTGACGLFLNSLGAKCAFYIFNM